jgi:hypothetical protein
MLTDEARSERKWGRFPALRELLEDRAPNDRRVGPTSVSDSVFDHLGRLVEVADTVADHETELLNEARLASSGLRSQLAQEIESLRSEFEAVTRHFDQDLERLARLRDEVYAAAR